MQNTHEHDARLQRMLNDQVQRQAALLTINASIQKIERVEDLESVIRIIYDQLKHCGVDFIGMTIRRFIDAQAGIVQTFAIVPTEKLQKSTEAQPGVYQDWKNGVVFYRPDIEHDPQGLPEDYFDKTYRGYNRSVRSLLTIPYHQGTLVLRSEHAHAFSESDIEFVRQIVEVLSIAINRVSDLERLEVQNRALDASEKRYRSLVQLIPHGILECDAAGIITFCNPAYAAMYGYAESELIGHAVWGLLATEDAKETLKAYFANLVEQRPDPEPYIAQGLTIDGRVIDVQVDWGYRRDEKGQVIGLVAVVTNITERKRIEAERIRTQRLRALGEMAAGVSHNLNNILTGIIGPAQLAQTVISNREALVEIEAIITSGLRAKELVGRLSRGLIGERDVLIPVDVYASIQEAILGSRPRWKDEQEAKGIAISIKTDLAEVPDIQGTEAGLHDILLNLA